MEYHDRAFSIIAAPLIGLEHIHCITKSTPRGFIYGFDTLIR
jgi:hypothetical protein